MTKGKLKAVVIIIVALLIISVVCSYLINKDSGTQEVEDTSSRVSITSADGEQTYSSDAGTQSTDTSTSTYTGTGTGTSTSTGTASGTTGTTSSVPQTAPTPTPNLGTVSTPNGTQPVATTQETPAPVATTEETAAAETADSTLGTITIPETEVVPEANYGRNLGTDTYYSNISDDIILQTTVSAQTYNANQVQVTVSVSVKSASLYCISTPVHISLGEAFTDCYSNAIQYSGGTSTMALTSQTFLVDVADGENITLPIQVIWEFNGTYAKQYIDNFECGGNFAIVRA